jgi:hypothetical protein
MYDSLSPYSGWPSGFSDYPDTGLSRIDPGTILASLDRGETDVFQPEPPSLDDLSWTGPILYNDPISWRQSYYLDIARALNQFVWKDAWDDWNLFDMSFATHCRDNPGGVTWAEFRYYKTIFNEGKIKYAWRSIYVVPEYLDVAWGGGAYFSHPIFGWKKIDLSRLKITAEEALKIAEANGGKEARSRIGNKCNIGLLLLPEYYDGWKVDYGSDFEILIDPYTGKIIP